MNNNKYYFDAYFELIDFINEKIAALKKIHQKQLNCSKKCTACCRNISVLPVEFYSILSRLQEKGQKPEQSSEKCSLMKDSLCLIYQLRPMICRTHGLPLAYCDEDDPSKKNISFCEMNFRDHIPEFDSENTLDMDEINIELVRLNEQFLRIFDEEDVPERIPLKDLADQF